MTIETETKRVTTRRGREEERPSREQETWSAEAVHDNYDDLWVEQGNLPEIEPRDGFEQRWIRSLLAGTPDIQRLSQAETQGWRRRDPGTINGKLSSLQSYLDGVGAVIGVSGMILMERPKRFGDVFRKMKAERDERQRRSVEEQLFNTHVAGRGFGRPYVAEDRTRVSQGKRVAPVADD